MAEENNIKLAVIVSQMFMQNTFVAWLEGSSECLLVDPGLEPDQILQFLEQEKLTPVAMLITHGHSDHIGGNAAIKEAFPDCPIYIGRGEAEFLVNPVLNLSSNYGIEIISPEADELLDENDEIEVAGLKFKVFDTPGHSPGHIIYVAQETEPFVFGGDVLFQQGVGRTDFPNGSFQQLKESIHNKMFTLPDETIVYTGHGEPTQIGFEKEHNPFVGKNATINPDEF